MSKETELLVSSLLSAFLEAARDYRQALQVGQETDQVRQAYLAAKAALVSCLNSQRYEGLPNGDPGQVREGASTLLGKVTEIDGGLERLASTMSSATPAGLAVQVA